MRLFLTILFLTTTCLTLSSLAEPSSGPLPRLQIEGNHFSTRSGKPVTLRGVSLCSLEWHKPLEQMDQVTASPEKWAVTVLRLPIQKKEWDRVGPQSYIRDYLDPAVASCKKNNVYCILDWHDIADWKNPETQKSLEGFWEQVAPLYAGDPRIMYELFNEPTSPGDQNRENWLAWRATAQKWVDSIRKDAPDTIILIGSPHWSQMPTFAADDPFRGKNLAYVMHLYPNWPLNTWDGLFGKASESVPIVLTEWGWSAQEKNAKDVFHGSQESFGEPLKQYLADKPQIGWTAWSYDQSCGPAMLGGDQDMGDFVKQWLKESR